MAPFRSSARTNRSGRLQAENDVFEGLPVRQWRQSEGTFGLPPTDVIQQDKDLIFPELPMPRDSQLLAPWTQQLLREARKPRTAKRKAEPAEEEKVEEDEEPKERQNHNGWSAKKWSQVPRQMEETEPEYLAKRRKGLSSSYSEAPAYVPQVATRKAKVRKFDAGGQQIIYEVIVPEGQTIEGEVKDEDISMLDAPALAPGTVVEGVGVANAEGQVVANDLLQPTPRQRRKPPPPKRKGGPGRGKKKVMFQRPPTEGAQGTGIAAPTATTDGATPSATTHDGTNANGTPAEGEEEDGEEGEGEEGDDGEDGDDDDREDGELSDDETPVPTAVTTGADVPPPGDSTLASDVPMPDAEPQLQEPRESAPPSSTVMPPPAIPGLAAPTEPIEPAPTPAEPATISTQFLPPQPDQLVAQLEDVKSDTQSDILPEIRAEARSDAQPDALLVAKPDSQQEPHPEGQADTQADAQSAAQQDLVTDAQLDVNPAADPAAAATEPPSIPGLAPHSIVQTDTASFSTELAPQQSGGETGETMATSFADAAPTEAIATAAVAAENGGHEYVPPVEASLAELQAVEAVSTEQPSNAPAVAEHIDDTVSQATLQDSTSDARLEVQLNHNSTAPPSADAESDSVLPDAPAADSVPAIADAPIALASQHADQLPASEPLSAGAGNEQREEFQPDASAAVNDPQADAMPPTQPATEQGSAEVDMTQLPEQVEPHGET